jgi:hypothetical protein
MKRSVANGLIEQELNIQTGAAVICHKSGI